MNSPNVLSPPSSEAPSPAPSEDRKSPNGSACVQSPHFLSLFASPSNRKSATNGPSRWKRGGDADPQAGVRRAKQSSPVAEVARQSSFEGSLSLSSETENLSEDRQGSNAFTLDGAKSPNPKMCGNVQEGKSYGFKSPSPDPKMGHSPEKEEKTSVGTVDIPLLDTMALSFRADSPTTMMASGHSLLLSMHDFEQIKELLAEGISFLHCDEEIEDDDENEWSISLQKSLEGDALVSRRNSTASTAPFLVSSEWEPSADPVAEEEVNVSPLVLSKAPEGFPIDPSYVQKLERQCRELTAKWDTHTQKVEVLKHYLQTAAFLLHVAKRNEEVLHGEVGFAVEQLSKWMTSGKGTEASPGAAADVRMLLQQLGYAYSNNILAAENKVLRHEQEQREEARRLLVMQRERQKGKMRVVVRVNAHQLSLNVAQTTDVSNFQPTANVIPKGTAQRLRPASCSGGALPSPGTASPLSTDGDALKTSLLLQADTLNHKLSIWNPSAHLSRVECLAYRVMAVPNIISIPPRLSGMRAEGSDELRSSELPSTTEQSAADGGARARVARRTTSSKATTSGEREIEGTRAGAAGLRASPSRMGKGFRSLNLSPVKTAAKSPGHAIPHVVSSGAPPQVEFSLPTASSPSTVGVTGDRASLAMTHVFPPHLGTHNTTDELFSSEVMPLVDLVIDAGLDAICIALGQAGSGKSYSLFGSPPMPLSSNSKGKGRIGDNNNLPVSVADQDNFGRPLQGECSTECTGLVQRSLEYLFQRLNRTSETESMLLQVHAQWYGAPPPLLHRTGEEEAVDSIADTPTSFLNALQAQLPCTKVCHTRTPSRGSLQLNLTEKEMNETPNDSHRADAMRSRLRPKVTQPLRSRVGPSTTKQRAVSPSHTPPSISPREHSQAVLPDFEIAISAYELYVDKVRDLLAPQAELYTTEEWQVGPTQRSDPHFTRPSSGPAEMCFVNPTCELKTKPNGEVEVGGLRWETVQSVEDAMNWVMKAILRRETRYESDTSSPRNRKPNASPTPPSKGTSRVDEEWARYGRNRSHVVLQLRVTTRKRRYGGPRNSSPRPTGSVKATNAAASRPYHVDPTAPVRGSSASAVQVHSPHLTAEEVIRQYMQESNQFVVRSMEREEGETGSYARGGGLRIVTRESNLVFVDLAGIERLSSESSLSTSSMGGATSTSTRERGKRGANEEAEAAAKLVEEQQLYLKEAQFITRSTSALVDVLSALGQRSVASGATEDGATSGGGAHIPYRSNKLTAVLQNVISRGAACVVLAHILVKPCPLVPQQLVTPGQNAEEQRGSPSGDDGNPFVWYPFLPLCGSNSSGHALGESQPSMGSDFVRMASLMKRSGSAVTSPNVGGTKGGRLSARVGNGPGSATNGMNELEEQWVEALRSCQERQEREIQYRRHALHGVEMEAPTATPSERAAPRGARKVGSLNLTRTPSAFARVVRDTATTLPLRRVLLNHLRCPTALGTYVTPKETLTTINFIQRIPQRTNATMMDSSEAAEGA